MLVRAAVFEQRLQAFFKHDEIFLRMLDEFGIPQRLRFERRYANLVANADDFIDRVDALNGFRAGVRRSAGKRRGRAFPGQAFLFV